MSQCLSCLYRPATATVLNPVHSRIKGLYRNVTVSNGPVSMLTVPFFSFFRTKKKAENHNTFVSIPQELLSWRFCLCQGDDGNLGNCNAVVTVRFPVERNLAHLFWPQLHHFDFVDVMLGSCHLFPTLAWLSQAPLGSLEAIKNKNANQNYLARQRVWCSVHF